MNWLAWLFVVSACAVVMGIVLRPAKQKSRAELLDEVNREERSRRGL